MDILQTILSIIGIKHIDPNLDGRNLELLLNGKSIEENPIFIESGDTQERKTGHLIGIRTTKYKYFRDISNPLNRVHLFNLEKDEYEENNISTTRPDLVEKMEKYISKINYEISSDSKIPDKKETKIIKDELRKLGYE